MLFGVAVAELTVRIETEGENSSRGGQEKGRVVAAEDVCDWVVLDSHNGHRRR